MKSGFGKFAMTILMFALIGGMSVVGVACGSAAGPGSAAKASSTTQAGQGNGASVANGQPRRGTVGTIDKIEANVVTLTTSQGSAKVNVSKNTTILVQKQGTVDDLKAGAAVTVIGDKRGDGSINATSIQQVGGRGIGGSVGAGGSGSAGAGRWRIGPQRDARGSSEGKRARTAGCLRNNR